MSEEKNYLLRSNMALDKKAMNLEKEIQQLKSKLSEEFPKKAKENQLMGLGNYGLFGNMSGLKSQRDNSMSDEPAVSVTKPPEAIKRPKSHLRNGSSVVLNAHGVQCIQGASLFDRKTSALVQTADPEPSARAFGANRPVFEGLESKMALMRQRNGERLQSNESKTARVNTTVENCRMNMAGEGGRASWGKNSMRINKLDSTFLK